MLYITLLIAIASSAFAQTCIIRVNAAGAVHAGMTMAQARAALPGATFKPAEDRDQLAMFIVTRGGKRVMDLYPDQDNRSKLEMIRVYDPACATVEGVHAGMLLRDVEKQFGKLTRVAMYEGEPNERAEFSKTPSWLDIESRDAGIYPQGKRCTDRFKTSATIESLWVSGPIENKIPEDAGFCSAPLEKK